MTKSITKKQILWKAEYIVNIEDIDIEHQKLFNLAQKCLESNVKNNNQTELKKTLLELFKYLKIHFLNEQNYMKSVNYPDLNNHILLHKDMTEELSDLIKNLDKLNFIEIENHLFHFIEEYFLNHIITQDKRINLWNTPLENLKDNLTWKDTYKVNNEFIDKDHKILFQIAQEAFECNGTHEHKVQKLKTTITKLYDYMKTHFKNEETHMKSINYPKVDEHIQLHNSIIVSLNDFIKKLSTIKIGDFEKELAKMIDITLLQHIIQEDRKIIKWESGN